MSALARLIPTLPNSVSWIPKFTCRIFQPITANFHSLTNDALQINPGGLFNISTRTVIRVHFPRPSERRRVKRHGWKTRMSTPEGRRVIMNRILKGRFVYTH